MALVSLKMLRRNIVSTENTNGLPTWDLSDLYDSIDDPRLDSDLNSMVDQAAAFEAKYKGRIASADVTADLLCQRTQRL